MNTTNENQACEIATTTDNNDKNDLLYVVANKIKDSGARVIDIVIDRLVSAEIENRVDLITKAIKYHDFLKKQLNKINRPDVRQFDTNGNEVLFTSEARRKDIDKQQENLNKLKTVIDNALNTNTEESFRKLKETHDKLEGSKGGS